MKTQPVAVAVFARAPLPGQTKTRLIPALGAAGAAELHARLILRTLESARAAATGPLSLWCCPDCGHPLFRRCREEFAADLRPQAPGDLGARMAAAFAALCPEGPALLVGTDCPALAPAHLRQAAAALRGGNDAVFLPAEDGGYVLAGLKRAEPALFEGVAWGGPAVMAATRRRLKARGLSWCEPATLWDVDRPADLGRLRASGLLNDFWSG